ncbi:nitroreductase family protein [Lysobacter sp. Root494]|uniref:nitroreductase family protein n=1 Tax=Lysobacter sp. Root494 TaxID=1736549 RepID=UPI000AAD09E0|nr:nitroreductase family protein [Lysobacter sp. Root494]
MNSVAEAGVVPDMRARIKALVPAERRVAIRRMLARLKVLSNYGYDARRFLAASSAGRSTDDAERLAAHISMDYHRLEKGMALPSPRYGFGRDVVIRLMRTIARYEREFGTADVTVFARGALAGYRRFNSAKIAPELEATIDRFLSECTSEPCGGVASLTAETLFPFESEAAQRFLLSRHSVRQFDGRPIAHEVLQTAVRIAQQAPSVCNRQSARAFVSTERSKMDDMLRLQNGNRGFGDRLGAVIVVASDMRAFTSMGERNQCWVDGGIFAMSLALALHSLHVGACMLNWSVEPGRDRALRRLLKLDDNYAVITMMGAGYPPDSLVVAASPRRRTESIVSFV